MRIDTSKYTTLVTAFESLMHEATDLADIRLAPDKWTLKEMIAHLIDSASNNHQRFVRLQMESVLTFPKYDAEEWKTVTAIAAFDYATLITLWKTYNLFLVHLIDHANPASMSHVWRREDTDMTLAALIEDYFVHMELHRVLFVERLEEIKR